jgi:hypothetical protein
MDSITGSCFCGDITYRVTSPLQDGRSCHCSRCRKAFSAQASAYAAVAPGAFEWQSGEAMLSSYVSQEGFGLSFCSRCGSTLCGTYKGDVHGVTLGCVDGNPDIEIGMHIFVDSKAHWEKLPEGGVQYAEGPPELLSKELDA